MKPRRQLFRGCGAAVHPPAAMPLGRAFTASLLRMIALWLFAACALPFAARAQYEIGAPGFNFISFAGAPFAPGGLPAVTTPQFAGVRALAAGSSARAATGTVAQRFPSAVYIDPTTGQATGTVIALNRSSVGSVFAIGVPRYFLGDFITPPAFQINDTTLADSNYWRPKPVEPGETFQEIISGVTTATVPIAANTTVNYYYSPHAERVFAAQSGRVTITWVARTPVNGRFLFKTESFVVSSATQRPVRTIYWTERSFSAPPINIPTGSIQTVNPVYNAQVPAIVAQEYEVVGLPANPNPGAAVPEEKRTLWFEKTAGVGQLRAYNVEGRILIEYLGGLKPGSTNAYEFLGADIVEIARVAPVVNVTVNLGDRILPTNDSGQTLPLNGDPELVAAPQLNVSVNSQELYGSQARADGYVQYYAERENDNPDRIVFYWLDGMDAGISLPGATTPKPTIYWPVLRNHYRQVWPAGVLAYQAHATVGAVGSTTETGIRFSDGQLPLVVFQDDPAQTATVIDPASQRLVTTFNGQSRNRSLLKFTSGNEVWYVRLYTQSESRSGYEESDGAAAINTTATVGQRLAPPAGHSVAGYIVRGTGYHPGAYLNPFSLGVAAAERGAIIPVNAVPGDNLLRVWWFKKVEPPSAGFLPFYVPAKMGNYTVSYPANPEQIILASNAGSGDLAPAEIAGGLYIQNNRALPGFNPNEEHALMIAGRAYALRDDLNNTTANASVYTSQPFVLISFTSPADQRPAMRVFRVVREAAPHTFNYTITAGTMLQGPMPLPLLPLPLAANGTVRNTEVAGVADSAHQAPADVAALYTRFTFADRKGYHWVYRGPHDAASPTFGMQYYYTMREGFFVPGVATQPAVGATLPYLRPLVSGVPQGDAVSGTSLTITYVPAWPSTAPELRVAETLTLPKFGLPDVFNQASAQVLYQQSIARQGPARASVVLHDPIREKTFALGQVGGLATLPSSLRTTTYQGKTYFQGLPPHLQQRVYLDPMRGSKGALVLVGGFVDVPSGEDYLDLNVLSQSDRLLLENLVSSNDANRTLWVNAIAGLSTRVETFIPNPERAGTFISNGSPVTRGPSALPEITNSDTAVVDYALTATGSGSGWVTMVFGNGRAFTPEGDPVAVKVFRVAPRLNTGDLKAQLSSNPLDEQVTLRHSGDFAARPEDYDFEWRYAPPQDGVVPPVYTYSLALRALGNWRLVSNPAAALPSASEYALATPVVIPRTVAVNSTGYDAASGRPGMVGRPESGLDFTAGVPAQIVFSANLSPLTGFVLYVNGVPVLAHQAPEAFPNATSSTGLAADGLPRQFYLEPGAFQRGLNRLEVALYSGADVGSLSSIDFRVHTSVETDRVVAVGSPWQSPNGTLQNIVTVGGSPTAPLGSPVLVLTDNYFTMRYRPKATANNVAGTEWSRWMQPVLVEGWIKRVLAAINPFNQRITDLYNNAVNTDVSILTQAGRRWEGDVALTLGNLNDTGLIEIYETVLNRGKAISVDAGYDYGPANDALLLAAGYINDLYTILGNEAFADAANPTISVDDSTTVTEVNTSRFSFEGQVKSVLEEELALLRGRDDFVAPGTQAAPAYNRLYWNYTRGINSGEALYAVNYNIREKTGASTADGTVNAADAQRMFPQGHGDAYGHYLTALKGYYRLLTNPFFTWTPRTEAVTVLGQPVQVDYFDERKFAASAASLARTSQQILALVHRESYRDSDSAGWSHFRDGKFNSATGVTRHWGLDEWAARSTQGAYFNWVVGNALLPDVDNNPQHTGIQVIDRTTVPALAELTLAGESSQGTMDNANARLNPLGLSPDAIAFDISPAELRAGKSHYEQIHDRALRAVLNAKGAFDQAARMTRLLRNQENQLESANNAIVDQEAAYTRQLVELYGTPYSGEIGAGRTYAQGYAGPDTLMWFVVDRPTDLVDTTAAITVTGRVPTSVQIPGTLSVDNLRAYSNDTAGTNFVTRTFRLQPDQFVQYSDRFTTSLGRRSVTGKLQFALLDAHQASIALQDRLARMTDKKAQLDRRAQLYDAMLDAHAKTLERTESGEELISNLGRARLALSKTSKLLDLAVEAKGRQTDALKTAIPGVTGLANDVFAGVRGAMTVGFNVYGIFLKTASVLSNISASYLDVQIRDEQLSITKAVEGYQFSYEQAQVAYEYEILLREVIREVYEIAQVSTNLQRAQENVRNLIAEGERVQAERELFRQRSAAIVQGYRTRDLTFRTFRNEGLEQYRTLFDLAARYTYLATKSYDYETGLLGSTSGQAVVNATVSARALGDLSGGVPQASVSTLGDSGLAGTMARLQADWAVAKGRLGLNNPDQYGTLFSLRRELFRLLNEPGRTDDDAAWQQTLEQKIVTNLLSDPDVAAACLNLRKPDNSAVPGIIIPFATTIEHGKNFFGLPLASGDHAYSASSFSTKIYATGVVLRGYVGMDPYSIGTPNAGTLTSTAPNALSATPYVYLIPAGIDYQRAPALGDTNTVRGWEVQDQALPLPFNLGSTAFSSIQFFTAAGTLSEQPWVLRKHQAFRPVNDPAFFYSSMPGEFTNSRLVGRSVWNSRWKLVIPAYTLHSDEKEALNRFVASVRDIELFLRTYSNAGN